MLSNMDKDLAKAKAYHEWCAVWTSYGFHFP